MSNLIVKQMDAEIVCAIEELQSLRKLVQAYPSDITKHSEHLQAFFTSMAKTFKDAIGKESVPEGVCEFDDITLRTWLYRHLVLWRMTGVAAPKNELESIQSWMGFLAKNTKEDTIDTMRTRMILLTNAVHTLHAAGPEAEDEAGIFSEVSREECDAKHPNGG